MGKKSSAIFFVFLVIWTDKFFQWFGMKKLYSIFIRNFFSSIPINSISSPSMKLIYDHSGMRCIFARYKQNLLVCFFSEQYRKNNPDKSFVFVFHQCKKKEGIKIELAYVFTHFTTYKKIPHFNVENNQFSWFCLEPSSCWKFGRTEKTLVLLN